MDADSFKKMVADVRAKKAGAAAPAPAANPEPAK
jgi:hypothetical protein